MIVEAPLLSAKDLQEELRLIHRARHHTLVTALYGQSDADAASIETLEGKAISFKVAQASSELGLRRALALAGSEPLVVLVNYDATRLPTDIAGRLAGRRVYAVDRARRLARMFGVPSASAELLACRPLCDALLDRGGSFGPLPGANVDLATAFRALLSREVGLPMAGSLSEERVLELVATARPAANFVAYLDNHPALRAELARYLDGESGRVAAIAWRAWEKGQGVLAAALAVVLEVAAPRLADNAYLRATVSRALGELDPTLKTIAGGGSPLAARWGELAAGLLRRLPDEVRARVLGEADRILDDAELDDIVAQSRDLPRAFPVLARRLGALLARAAEDPTAEAVEAVRGEEAKLSAHRLAGSPQRSELASRARMAARLVAYLAERRARAAELEGGGTYDPMLALAAHYVEHGGHVDLARTGARGSVDGPLEKAIVRVLAAVDELRDADDERFAQQLVQWAAAGYPTTQRVTRMEQALDQLAVQFLEGQAHRRLLVLLLDGMAWANAVELVRSLEAHHFHPLRWGHTRIKPLLAALPTITSVSRAALFAGKRPAPGEPEDTSRDPARFAAHRSLSKILGKEPELLLRPDVETASGDASSQALSLVRSEDRIVALVINAIDDQLKGSKQLRVSWEVSHIKPLPALLQAAAEARRAVLLIADHGHVLGVRGPSPVMGEGGGKRWRPLGQNDAPRANEVELGGDACWRPRGKPRIAMLFRETEAYGGSAHVGEHGGASLAEVVTPAILVAPADLRSRVELDHALDDPELEVMSPPRPEWWDITPRVTRARAAPPAEPSHAIETPLAPALKQLAIPFGSATPEPHSSPRSPGKKTEVSPWRSMLSRSKYWKELVLERGEPPPEALFRWIEILAEHGGKLGRERFAQEAEILASRVRGVAATMAEWLNAGGYEVVVYNYQSHEVHLDLALLRELFGEE